MLNLTERIEETRNDFANKEALRLGVSVDVIQRAIDITPIIFGEGSYSYEPQVFQRSINEVLMLDALLDIRRLLKLSVIPKHAKSKATTRSKKG